MNADTEQLSQGEQDLRNQAIERIKRRRRFPRDVALYVLVNAGLWVIWALDGAKTDDLWPAIVMGVWGVLLVVDAFKAFVERPVTSDDIDRELSRLQGR